MIKFALIGCGRIAVRHSELLGNKKIANGCLVAVCDIYIEKKLKKLAESLMCLFIITCTP